MKEKRLNKILAISSVVFLFILIIQLNFCNRARAVGDKNRSKTKSCSTFLVNEIIQPSQYHYNSYLNKNFEKDFSQPNWSIGATATSWRNFVFVSGYNKYSYYKKRIKLPLCRAQLQVYLC